MHIPRTGGNALWNYCFAKWFGDKAFLHCENAFKATSGCVVRDHWCHSMGRNVEKWYPEASQFVCYLRDPVQRALSWYALWRDAGTKVRMPYGEYNMSEMNITLFIALLHDVIRDGLLDCLPAGDYPLALDNFVFVGIQERFQQCTDALARVLGKEPIKCEVVNAAGFSRKDLSGSDEKRLQKLLEKDQEIYEHTVKTWRPIWDAR